MNAGAAPLTPAAPGVFLVHEDDRWEGQLFTSLRETVGTGSVLGLKVPLGVDGDLTHAAFDDQSFGYVRVTDDFKSLQIDNQPATGTPADSIAIDLRTQPLERISAELNRDSPAGLDS